MNKKDLEKMRNGQMVKKINTKNLFVIGVLTTYNRDGFNMLSAHKGKTLLYSKKYNIVILSTRGLGCWNWEVGYRLPSKSEIQKIINHENYEKRNQLNMTIDSIENYEDRYCDHD